MATLPTDTELVARIEELKAERDAVILAHFYVEDAVQDVADHTGDSYNLSKLAADLDCATIVFAGVQFSFSGYFCAYGKSGLSFLHNTLSILLVRVPGAYLASKFFPQTLLPMGLASACGSLFSILVCVIAYHWLKRQQKAVLHG